MRSLIARECVEVYVHAGDPPSLLLLRRPPARGGIWVPVSGKVESTDADWPSAARRELAEETGFEGVRLASLDWPVVFAGLDGAPWRLHAFSAGLPERRAPRLSEEHEAFEWCALREAIDRLHYPDNRWAARRLAVRLAGPAGSQTFSPPAPRRTP